MTQPYSEVRMKWREVSGSLPPVVKNHTTTLVGDELIVFGGFDGRHNHNSTHIFNCTTQRWQKYIQTSGQLPKGRNGHTATYAKGKIWVIGGWLGEGPFAAEDVVTFQVEKRQWEKPETKGSGPGPCNMHSSDYLEHDNSLYVFRGGDAVAYMSDLHTLNVDTLEWKKPETKGKQPLPRANHSSAVIRDKLYIFGGWDGQSRLNDIHVLDTRTKVWEAIRAAGPQPVPRAGMSLTAVRNKLFLFGGSGAQTSCFNDLHVFDTDKRVWLDTVPHNQVAPVSNADASPGTAAAGPATWSEGELPAVQQGSGNPNSEPDQSGIVLLGAPPSWRAGHTATLQGRMLYVFGGSYSSNYRSDMFVLDTDFPPCIGFPPTSSAQIFQRSVRQYINSEEFSDVTFMVEGKPVYAHRIVLSLMSDHFRTMFNGGFRESKDNAVTVSDIPYDVFLVMIEYLYTGVIPSCLKDQCDMRYLTSHPPEVLDSSVLSPLSISTAHFTFQLLHVSDLYMLSNLKWVCEAVLQRVVNVENVEQVLAEASKYNASRLESVCKHLLRNIEYMKIQPEEVKNSDEASATLEDRLVSSVGQEVENLVLDDPNEDSEPEEW